jgi:hypothetical protein
MVDFGWYVEGERRQVKEGFHTEATEKGKATENHGDSKLGAAREAHFVLPPWCSVAFPFSVASV